MPDKREDGRTIASGLTEREPHLRQIFEASPIGMALLDLDGRFLRVNRSFCTFLGYDADELRATSFQTVTHPDDLEADLAMARRLIDGEIGTYRKEKRYLHKQGHAVWALLARFVVRDDAGVAQYGVAQIVDIDERKRAEAARLASEARFRLLLEVAPDGIVVVHPDGRIAIANAQAEHIFGYAPGTLIGRSVDELLPINLRERHQRYRVDYARDPRTRPMGIGRELFGRRADGSEFSATVSLSPLHDEGESLVIAIVRDVTREREFDQLKDDFLATVSHELRTPVTSILGYIDLIMDGVGGPLPPAAHRYLSVVQADAVHLTRVIDNVLDVAQLQAGVLSINPETVDIGTVITGVADSLAPLMQSKRQSFSVNTVPHLPLVWADPAHLTQILFNLISNGHKYTPDEGAITVSATGDDRWVYVEIADSGIGISAEEQGRIFARFYRAAGVGRHAAGGAGLGLAITRALVELHGGLLQVSSEPGVGSTFGFTVPVARTSPS